MRWRPLSTGTACCLALLLQADVARAPAAVTTATEESLGDLCTWVRYAPKEGSPGARYGHTLVTTRTSKMVLFGGFDGAFNNNYMNDMWLWDITPYTTAPAASIDEDGNEKQKPIGDKFDAGKWRIVKQTGTIPPGRYGHVATVVDETDEMVVFGGNSGQEDLLGDLWVFNMRTQLWKQHLPPQLNTSWPMPRASAAAADVDGFVYMFGGWSSIEGPIAELWVLDLHIDPATETLTQGTTPTWELRVDSCDSSKVRATQPQRCAATDEVQCAAVNTQFGSCTQYDDVLSPDFSGSSCDGGVDPACSFYPATGTVQPKAGCVGKPSKCARAGECVYTAPNLTLSECTCSGLSNCLTFESHLSSSWGESVAEISGCAMESGPQRAESLFLAKDTDNSQLIDGNEVPSSVIVQYDTGGAGSNNQLLDGKLSAEEYYHSSPIPKPTCTASYTAICAAVVNDGTAATCESAGHCTYYPAIHGRSCGYGPSARFGHAAIKVSVDFMIFGGHSGTSYLADLWRYDTQTKLWSAIRAGSTDDGDVPVGRAFTTAVPMGGGLLIFGGYTNECEDGSDCADDEQPLELLEDVWAFSNPAGTVIKTTTATVKTLTQTHEISNRTMIVNQGDGPQWYICVFFLLFARRVLLPRRHRHDRAQDHSLSE